MYKYSFCNYILNCICSHGSHLLICSFGKKATCNGHHLRSLQEEDFFPDYLPPSCRRLGPLQGNERGQALGLKAYSGLQPVCIISILMSGLLRVRPTLATIIFVRKSHHFKHNGRKGMNNDAVIIEY